MFISFTSIWLLSSRTSKYVRGFTLVFKSLWELEKLGLNILIHFKRPQVEFHHGNVCFIHHLKNNDTIYNCDALYHNNYIYFLITGVWMSQPVNTSINYERSIVFNVLMLKKFVVSVFALYYLIHLYIHTFRVVRLFGRRHMDFYRHVGPPAQAVCCFRKRRLQQEDTYGTRTQENMESTLKSGWWDRRCRSKPSSLRVCAKSPPSFPFLAGRLGWHLHH